MFGSGSLAVILLVILLGANGARASWDASENRRNSFARVDEAALGQIRQPLRITVYLSPEDPRLTDYDQNVLCKLARVLPQLEVVYASNSRTGLFEKPEDHYGEIWYEMNGLRVMDRSTIEEVVLEQIYKLAGTVTPSRAEENVARGYPLVMQTQGAAILFYAVWPLAILFLWWITNRR